MVSSVQSQLFVPRIQKRYRAADGGAELPQQIEGEGYFVPEHTSVPVPSPFLRHSSGTRGPHDASHILCLSCCCCLGTTEAREDVEKGGMTYRQATLHAQCSSQSSTHRTKAGNILAWYAIPRCSSQEPRGKKGRGLAWSGRIVGSRMLLPVAPPPFGGGEGGGYRQDCTSKGLFGVGSVH